MVNTGGLAGGHWLSHLVGIQGVSLEIGNYCTLSLFLNSLNYSFPLPKLTLLLTPSDALHREKVAYRKWWQTLHSAQKRLWLSRKI